MNILTWLKNKKRNSTVPRGNTPMLEWADKVVSKTAAEKRVGSSPTWSTKRTQLFIIVILTL